MSGQVSSGSAVEYQADEPAGDRFALGEAPGTDIRVPREEPHMEEVAGWTDDLEPTPGPKSLLRGTAPGTEGNVGLDTGTQTPRPPA